MRLRRWAAGTRPPPVRGCVRARVRGWGGVCCGGGVWGGWVRWGEVATFRPGFALFETNRRAPYFSSQPPMAPNGTEIPPGFFGPGSDAFTGQVNFGGVPLQTFTG